jgi:chromatin structure-remodeling complex protein RSC7
MSSAPRIVLKPRRAPTIKLPRRGAPDPEPEPDAEPEPEPTPAVSDADDADDADVAMDVDAPPPEDARTPDVVDVDGEDAGSARGASEAASDAPQALGLEFQAEAGPSRVRGRGRPRGRPRGSRGRGRGRGRGVTIRLPREDGEDGAGPGEPGEDGGEEDGRPQFKKVGSRTYVIDGDELATDDDPKGDTKIDRDGSLVGGALHIPLPAHMRR